MVNHEEEMKKIIEVEKSTWHKIWLGTFGLSYILMVCTVLQVIMVLGFFVWGPPSNLSLSIRIAEGMMIYYCMMLCMDMYGIVRHGYLSIKKILMEAMLVMMNAYCIQIMRAFL